MSIKRNDSAVPRTAGRMFVSALAVVCAGAIGVGCSGDSSDPWPITNNNNNGTPTPPTPPPGTPTLSLTSPVESEVLPREVPLTVTWTSANLSNTTVVLSYSVDDGVTYTVIANNLPSSGSTTWTPPNGTTEARLRLESSTGALRDDMNHDFVFRRVWFVNPTATGLRDGRTWATGVERIRTAHDDLASPGDQIWVANTGTQTAFNPGDACVVELKKSGVGVYGGFSGTETALSQRPASFTRTTIDAEDARIGVLFVDVAAVTTLDGFRVTRGVQVGGAGVRAVRSNVAMKNCAVDACDASQWGGGAAFFSSDATVTDCTFSTNTAVTGGGGLFAIGDNTHTIAVTGCTFSENQANGADSGDGGGVSVKGNVVTTFKSCTFSKNSATRDGGGLYANASSPSLDGCQFTENTAARNGGGVAQIFGTPDVVASTFTQNASDGAPAPGFPAGIPERLVFGAGGLYTENVTGGRVKRSSFFANTATNGAGVLSLGGTMSFENCVIADNTASGRGGGVFVGGNSNVTLSFCTVTRNAAVKGAGYGFMASNSGRTITSSILYANVSDQAASFEPEGVNVTVSFSDVQGGFGGANNFDADPLFLNPGSRDFKLAAGSPAIGAANPTGAPARDRDDLARDAAPDAGAYERR